MGFRHLEDLRDIHKREEIWVAGCGPSLQDYPKDFLDGKVSIAVNQAFLAFPNCTYYHSFHVQSAEWVAKNWPDKFSRCILGCLCDPKPAPPKQRRNRYEGSGEAPIYVKVKAGTSLDRNRFKEAAEHIMAKESCELIDNITTLHTAIQVAIILGAAKVTLIGCEAKMKDGVLHARNTWMDKDHDSILAQLSKAWIENKFFPLCRKGVVWLAETYRPYGIEIVRYYYGKGYEEVKLEKRK